MWIVLISLIVCGALLSKYKEGDDQLKILNVMNEHMNNNIIDGSIDKKNKKSNLRSIKPNIWIYIEDEWNSRDWKSFYSRLTLGNTPNYILLCLFSIYLRCYHDFNIIIMNPKTIYYYLPELKIKMGSESTISIKKRRQYISYYLLEKYGGIWMEPSIIVMKNLMEIFKYLKKYHFIGFSCPKEYRKCNGCKFKPSTDIMISRRNNILMKMCRIEIEKMVNSYNYPSYNFNKYGDCVLWKYLPIAIDEYRLKYLQLSPDYSGTRDNNNTYINVDNYLSKNSTNFRDINKVYVVIINYDTIAEHQKYNWFLRFSLDQILKSNLWINKLFTRSYRMSNIYYYDPIFYDCNYNDKNCNCIVNFGRLECFPNDVQKINEYDYVKDYKIPSINHKSLVKMLNDCNYFSTVPWIDVYNRSPNNN